MKTFRFYDNLCNVCNWYNYCMIKKDGIFVFPSIITRGPSDLFIVQVRRTSILLSKLEGSEKKQETLKIVHFMRIIFHL